MKPLSTAILVASLAANVAIAYLLFAQDAAPAATTSSSAKPAAPSAAPSIDSQIWADLKPDDLPGLVERLRASGFPPHLVRAIVAAQLNQDLEAGYKARRGDSREYWKSSVERDREAQKALVQLSRERQKQLEALLGINPEDEGSDAMLAYLSADKVKAVRQVNRDHSDRLSELFQASGTVDSTKYRELRKQQHDALAAVLTPEELLEYDLRNSSTASSLRMRLAGFSPSESEFRAIYALQAQFDEQFSNLQPGMSQEQMRARMDAQKALTEQIKGVLSPDRAALYEKMSNTNYARASQLVARLELPPETTDRLFDLQKEYQQRRTQLMRGPSAARSMAQVKEQAAALQQEAVGKLTTLLGSPSAVEAYKQYGGSWVESMVPRATPSGAMPAVVAPPGTTTTIIMTQ